MEKKVAIFYCETVMGSGSTMAHSMIIGYENYETAQSIYKNVKKMFLMTKKETDAFEEEIKEGDITLSLVSSISEGVIYERIYEFKNC